MKEWKRPQIETCDISHTESGGIPSNQEKNGGFMNGLWNNATYDSVNWEKCSNGQIIHKKYNVES